MQRHPLAAQQRLRQRPVARAEQHRLQPRAAALAFHEGADRRRLPPDAIGPHHPRALQHQHRLLVAGAERRQPRQLLRQFRRAARHRQRALHQQIGRRRATPPPPPAARPGTRGTPPAAPRARENPAAIGCPPPVVSMPAWRAAITARAEVEPGHRAAGALGHAVGDAGHAGRAVEALLDPPGDDADHARMPLRPRHQQRRVAGRDLRLGRLHRRVQHRRLDLLALAVHRVQRRRERHAPPPGPRTAAGAARDRPR